jgi:hypothetical protein
MEEVDYGRGSPDREGDGESFPGFSYPEHDGASGISFDEDRRSSPARRVPLYDLDLEDSAGRGVAGRGGHYVNRTETWEMGEGCSHDSAGCCCC